MSSPLSVPPGPTRFLEDPTFPAFPGSPPDANLNGITERGTIRPRIIQLEDFENTDIFTMTPRSVGNTTGADWVVSILHKHSPEVLLKFLDVKRYPQFSYTHRHRDGPPPEFEQSAGMWPFHISRLGNRVEAGLRRGYEGGKPSGRWDMGFVYTMRSENEWMPDQTSVYDPAQDQNVVTLPTGSPSPAATAAFEKIARTVNGVLNNPRPWTSGFDFGIEVHYVYVADSS